MAKFRFYYTDPYTGCVYGTDSREEAAELGAGCEDFFVIDAETGTWIREDGTAEEVHEYKPGN